MNDLPCLCASLRQAALASTENFDRVLAPTGLKITMFRLLRKLSKLDRPTISELAATLNLDRSTLGRNLKVLARQKLVKFGSGKDERARLVILTPEGKAILKTAIPLWEIAQKRLVLSLGDDAEPLLKILMKISNEPADSTDT